MDAARMDRKDSGWETRLVSGVTDDLCKATLVVFGFQLL